MSNKNIRLSASHEISELIVTTWVCYSMLRMLGFQSWQITLSLIGVKGEDGRYICLQLFANGKRFEIAISRWNLTGGEFDLAWNEFCALLAAEALDRQMLADSWKEIFHGIHISEIPAEMSEFGIIIPEPDGLNASIAGSYTPHMDNSIALPSKTIDANDQIPVVDIPRKIAKPTVATRVPINVVKRARDLSIN